MLHWGRVALWCVHTGCLLSELGLCWLHSLKLRANHKVRGHCSYLENGQSVLLLLGLGLGHERRWAADLVALNEHLIVFLEGEVALIANIPKREVEVATSLAWPVPNSLLGHLLDLLCQLVQTQLLEFRVVLSQACLLLKQCLGLLHFLGLVDSLLLILD